MKACIIAVGSEMLTPFRVDTNSLFITERLNDDRLRRPLEGGRRRRRRRAGRAVRERARRGPIVIVVTGGLGPTEDDSRATRSRACSSVPLDVDESIVERLRERFARRGMTMPEINRRQAMVPRGAHGAAEPERHRAGPLDRARPQPRIVLLPGPPREMKPMLEAVDRRAAGAAAKRRRAVPPRAQDHRPHRVGRRRAGAAGLRPVAGAADSDQHDDSRGARSDRAAPDGPGGEQAPTPTRRSTRRSSELQDVLGPSVYSVDGRGSKRSSAICCVEGH